jgi:glycosyltransferase involved in cell wall biosynthesis
MKVFFVTRGYPIDKYPLNGIFEYDQAKALAQAGHDVVYLAVDLRSIRRHRKWGFESLFRDGIHIEAINIPLGRVPKYLLHATGKMALRKLFKRAEKEHGTPDIVHSHFINYGYLSAKVLGGQGIPLMHTEHYSGMHSSTLSSYAQKMGDKTYKLMDMIIAVSQSLATSIQENFGIEAKVVPNIVDIDAFMRTEPTVPRNEGKFSFISVGNLNPGKKMDLLIESFGEAFKNDEAVSLFIYGDGIERANLKKIIERLSLQDQISLEGFAPREAIAKKMHESNCFVLVSDSETFGVVFIEAMAAGLPVIATRCGGPEDFVNSSNGLLIERNNLKELVEALKYMYNNSHKYDRSVIASDVEKKYAPRVIGQSLLTLYRSLLDKKTEKMP